jgi:hypothetical protein
MCVTTHNIISLLKIKILNTNNMMSKTLLDLYANSNQHYTTNDQ